MAFYKALKLHKENNYDIVWSVMANYAGFGALFFKLFRPRVKFLLTLQEGDPISHIKSRVWFVYPLFRMIFKKADYIQAISKFLADFGKNMGHSKKIEIIPNGVDLDIFSKNFNEAEKEKIKILLGKKEGDIFLVTTSRLTHKNATDSIISALVALPKNIYLIVIGKGEEGARLQKQAEVLKVSHRVKFLGFIPYEEIPKYFSVCDLFVRASRSEGFGNSFIEAMAAKLPVIATPVGGIVDFIDDRETGIFCSPDCPQSIVKSVNLLIENKTLKEKIINNAQNRVIERYDWNDVADKMEKLFSKITLNEK